MNITPQQALLRTIEHREIGHDEMLSLMRAILHGEVSSPMVAAILTGLRVRRETVGEIAAAAQVMREFVVRVPATGHHHLVDLCGTGGDGAHTFNISTAAAIVTAAAGAKVAKHGNRSVSSQCGSADILEALGANLMLTPEQIAASIDQVGIGFMMTPNHHPAMKPLMALRKEMGVRSMFNILGPLVNPAGAPNQLMGVFHADLVGMQARVLQRLGANHAMIVHGHDGLDEISISGATLVAELVDGEIREYELHPQQFGLPCAPLAQLQVNNIEQAQAMLQGVLENRPGPARNIVLLNSAAALYCANRVDSIAQGVALAEHTLASGAAREKLAAMLEFSRRFAH